MVVVAVVLALIAVGALVWGARSARAVGIATTRIVELEQSTTEIGTARDEAVADRDAEKRRAEGLASDLTTARAELTAATTDSTAAGQRATDAEARVADLETEVTAAESRMSVADEALVALRAEVAEVSAARDALVVEVEKGTAAVLAVEARLAEQEHERALAESSGLASALSGDGGNDGPDTALASSGAGDSDGGSDGGSGEPAGPDAEPEAHRRIGDAPGDDGGTTAPSDIEARDAGGATGDAWLLEARRFDRLWRERVAVTPDGPSPLAGPDAIRGAVGVVAEASREETGVIVDLRWEGDGDVPVALAVPLVRVAEELVALARDSDGGEMVVTVASDTVVLVLRTDPLVELDSDLAAAVVALGGTASTAADGTVRVSL